LPRQAGTRPPALLRPAAVRPTSFRPRPP
jgi:hypothetical protein